MDTRPLEDPARAPTTALYLGELLAAYDAEPIEGESFAFLVGLQRPDPTEAFARLDVAARRRIPPSRLLRSGALTVDPFLLRGASIGSAWWADQSGAAGAVFHTAAGAIPIGSRLPVVATLLDLAPWELRGVYQRSPAAAFGQRLAGSDPAQRGGRDRRDRGDRDRGSGPAPRPARANRRRAARGPGGVPAQPARRFAGPDDEGFRAQGQHRGRHRRPTLGPRAAGPARALPRLFRPLRRSPGPGLADRRPRPALGGRPARRPRSGDRLAAAGPAVGASPEDRAALARATARQGVGDLLAYAPAMTEERMAALVSHARAAILPSISEAAGLPAIEAIAAGTPVIASAVGALPEIVGGAGILVEPRDPDKLAAAIATAWTEDGLWDRLRAEALSRSGPESPLVGRRRPGDQGRLHRCRRPALTRGRGHRHLSPGSGSARLRAGRGDRRRRGGRRCRESRRGR